MARRDVGAASEGQPSLQSKFSSGQTNAIVGPGVRARGGCEAAFELRGLKHSRLVILKTPGGRQPYWR